MRIKILLVTIILSMLVSLQAQNFSNKNERIDTIKLFELPQLKYGFDALEPHIDKMTMEIHHGKHHAAYVNNLNNALTENNISVNSIEELMENISKYPVAVRNNGGGHYNHTMFWEIIGPNAVGNPVGNLAKAIDETFGSFEKFKEQFTKAAISRFGSGWAWLVVSDGKLVITSTPNQDNTLMDIAEVKGFPVLGLDVWEHAYYLKYQNRRADYINSFWNIVNWEEVEKRYNSVK